MENNTHFATFGSCQLLNFRIRPMNVILLSGEMTEEEFRERLRQEPFNNAYCTTYPIDKAAEMEDLFGMVKISLEDLLKLEN